MQKSRLRVNVCFAGNVLDMVVENDKDMNLLMEFIEEMNSKRKSNEKLLQKVPGLD